MKYIRTEDGHIYETTGQNERKPRYYNVANTNREIAFLGIVMQGDTIEELCDAFVMFCPNAHRRKIRVYETMHSISLYSKRDKRWNGNMVDKVYGAIWTDKGLIYVAKMNEKGELELL